jgi:site-specific DNA-methyltransferase (adenine-specific)
VTGIFHIVLARKPLEGTIAENCLQWGCGVLWIEGCRIGTVESLNGGAYAEKGSDRYDGANNWRYKRKGGAGEFVQPFGRFPANLILGGKEVVGLFPESKSGGVTHQPKRSGYSGFRTGRDNGTHVYRESDSGSASRFFFNFSEQESDE